LEVAVDKSADSSNLGESKPHGNVLWLVLHVEGNHVTPLDALGGSPMSLAIKKEKRKKKKEKKKKKNVQKKKKRRKEKDVPNGWPLKAKGDPKKQFMM